MILNKHNINVKFIYDVSKSDRNREKHGISFKVVQWLWAVPAVELEARNEGEPRYMRVGKLDEKFYSCIYTMRGDVIRLISARRSRKTEETLYYENVKKEE